MKGPLHNRPATFIFFLTGMAVVTLAKKTRLVEVVQYVQQYYINILTTYVQCPKNIEHVVELGAKVDGMQCAFDEIKGLANKIWDFICMEIQTLTMLQHGPQLHIIQCIQLMESGQYFNFRFAIETEVQLWPLINNVFEFFHISCQSADQKLGTVL